MINKALEHVQKNEQANIDRLLKFLRIPSISTDPKFQDAMAQAAAWVGDIFQGCGIKHETIKTAGHPAIFADSGPAAKGGPTLLVYGHYDVQPTGDLSLWKSGPFEPVIRDGSIVARGSADDKGQVCTHLFALEAWMKTVGALPVRVKFLIEGEEEVGSPNLADLIRKNASRLACDYVVLSDTAKFDAATPAITYGTKGLVYKQIDITGPKHDLHSGSFGGSLTNPGNALVRILASMRDRDNRVSIPGFYDDVLPISDEERKKMRALPFDDKAYAATIGVSELDGEKGYSTIERRWCRPTLDINGLHGGFTGPGSATILPAKMMAKASMRLVPNQDPQKISQAFDKAVKDNAPPGIKIEIQEFTNCAAYMCPLDSPGIKVAEQAVAAGYGKKPAFIREGGTLPILPLFKQVLGAESLMLGFCDPNCNAHGPNEFFAVDDLRFGTRSAVHLLDLFAKG